MRSFGVVDVVARVSDAAFGRPLVTNVLRGQVVEAINAFALEPDWIWCAADYKSWDFERGDGLRLEVKQSACKQTWAAPVHGRVSTGFDIRVRTGRWEGERFVKEPGRAADIYVFAYHGVCDEAADHRNPSQWQFYVVPTTKLPDTKRIRLSAVARLAMPVGIDDLRRAIDSYASCT